MYSSCIRYPRVDLSMHVSSFACDQIYVPSRSESFNRIGSPTKVRGSLARVAALPPSPPASSFQHQSRSLGDAALTVDTTAGGGGGGGGEGDSSSLKKRARIGYLIMLSGVEELHKTKRLLKV